MASTQRGINYPVEGDWASKAALAEDFAELALSVDAAFGSLVDQIVEEATGQIGDLGRILQSSDTLDDLKNGVYVVPTGTVADALGLPATAHGILIVERWGANREGAGLAIFHTRTEPSRTWTYVWNTDGSPAAGWMLEGLPPYQKERHLTTDDVLDDLEAGLWIVPTSGVATAMDLPEAAHGVLRVERWSSGWGLARFETRTEPSHTWSYIWGSGGVPAGGWFRADSDRPEANDTNVSALVGTAASDTRKAVVAAATPPLSRPNWLYTFQPGSDNHGFFTVSGSGAEPTADTSDYLMGTQSLQFAPSNGQSDAFRSQDLNLDMTGKGLAVLVKIDSESGGSATGLRVIAGDILGGNYAQWDIVRPRATAPHGLPDEWMLVKLAPQTIVGTGPDWSAVKRIQVGSPSTSYTRTWHLQAIGTFDYDLRFPSGVITLTFDDGEEEVLEAARRVLTPRGMAGTCYAIRQRTDTAGYLTTENLQELHYTHGWTIGAHGLSSYTAMTPSELRDDWDADLAFFQASGLPRPRHMAYMGGNVNDTVVKVAREFFVTGRTIAPGLEPYPPGDPYRLRALTAISDSGSGNSIADAKTWIDRAVNGGHWLNLVFHKIVDTATQSDEISWDGFEEVIDYIAQSGAAVRTTDEVFTPALVDPR